MSYAKSDLIEVHAFTRQKDGNEVVIGRPETNVFLALPEEALEILDNLARGKTVGEAQAEFARAHSIEPDIDNLLKALELRGFVRARGNDSAVNLRPGAGNLPADVRYHFANIPESVARRFFGPVQLTAYLTLIAAALVAAIVRPELIPGPGSLIFSEHRTAKIVSVGLLAYGTIFLHELAHLLAARAQGVKSRIGLSNRLWILVAETDMTGLWAVPRRQRYLPMLAGPLLDSVSASILFLLLFAQSEGAFKLLPMVEQFFRAMIFIYLFRLLWQCFLFVRTDFYYVLTTYFGCKNLMRDTQIFIGNLLRRLVGSPNLLDQSYLPAHELRVVRLYSVLWVVGRGVALASLFLITLPILYQYLSSASRALYQGYGDGAYKFIDAVVVGALNLLPLVAGLSLWITSIVRRRGSLER